LVILVLSFPLSKALLILYSKIALISRGFHLAYWVIGIGPIIAMLSGTTLLERGSRSPLLVPHTISILLLEWARLY
jgi:hypothetical protein